MHPNFLELYSLALYLVKVGVGRGLEGVVVLRLGVWVVLLLFMFIKKSFIPETN